ncbi:DUF1707 domain-containing protein [Tessaracoccus sp. HDW20]|nr:DUF1707 domain-containing protein [Tessaracoccus coleopterorum]
MSPRIDELRCADQDRELVAQVLNNAYAEGRLTFDEHAERIAHAYDAKTFGDLDVLTVDLVAPTRRPAPPRGARSGAPAPCREARRVHRRQRHPLVAAPRQDRRRRLRGDHQLMARGRAPRPGRLHLRQPRDHAERRRADVRCPDPGTRGSRRQRLPAVLRDERCKGRGHDSPSRRHPHQSRGYGGDGRSEGPRTGHYEAQQIREVCEVTLDDLFAPPGTPWQGLHPNYLKLKLLMIPSPGESSWRLCGWPPTSSPRGG